jgi:hypothetical protein
MPCEWAVRPSVPRHACRSHPVRPPRELAPEFAAAGSKGSTATSGEPDVRVRGRPPVPHRGIVRRRWDEQVRTGDRRPRRVHRRPPQGHRPTRQQGLHGTYNCAVQPTASGDCSPQYGTQPVERKGEQAVNCRWTTLVSPQPSAQTDRRVALGGDAAARRRQPGLGRPTAVRPRRSWVGLLPYGLVAPGSAYCRTASSLPGRPTAVRPRCRCRCGSSCRPARRRSRGPGSTSDRSPHDRARSRWRSRCARHPTDPGRRPRSRPRA